MAFLAGFFGDRLAGLAFGEAFFLGAALFLGEAFFLGEEGAADEAPPDSVFTGEVALLGEAAFFPFPAFEAAGFLALVPAFLAGDLAGDDGAAGVLELIKAWMSSSFFTGDCERDLAGDGDFFGEPALLVAFPLDLAPAFGLFCLFGLAFLAAGFLALVTFFTGDFFGLDG